MHSRYANSWASIYHTGKSGGGGDDDRDAILLGLSVNITATATDKGIIIGKMYAAIVPQNDQV